MFIKLISALYLATFVIASPTGGDKAHPALVNPFVSGVCSANADPNACAAIASRCLFRPPRTDDAQTPLCQCKSSLTDVQTYYKTWVSTENKGVDICVPAADSASAGVPTGIQGNPPPISFKDYLISKDPKLEHNLACCVAKTRGLFDESGSIIATAWSDLTSDMKDEAAKTATLSSISTCVGTVTSCNSFDVIHCVTQRCYDALKGAP